MGDQEKEKSAKNTGPSWASLPKEERVKAIGEAAAKNLNRNLLKEESLQKKETRLQKILQKVKTLLANPITRNLLLLAILVTLIIGVVVVHNNTQGPQPRKVRLV